MITNIQYIHAYTKALCIHDYIPTCKHECTYECVPPYIILSITMPYVNKCMHRAHLLSCLQFQFRKFFAYAVTTRKAEV